MLLLVLSSFVTSGFADDARHERWTEMYLHCLPELSAPPQDLFPLIAWESVGEAPLPASTIKALFRRGLVQHVRLSQAAIPTAKMLQQAGVPLIVMDFEPPDSMWPYSLLADDAWLLKEQGGEPGADQAYPDFSRFDAWKLASDQIREVLQAFKAEGLKVDAFWLDMEGKVSVVPYAFAMRQPALRTFLPQIAQANPGEYQRYLRQLWIQLLSGYVAGPIREFYPQASVNNWVATLSSAHVPVLSWENWPHPDLSASLFTATNPVAYGIDLAFLPMWPKERPFPEQSLVDRIYTHIILRQVSADTANRLSKAPYLHAVPWVARDVRERGDLAPAMSRWSYRESLRHLWLRGIAGMQVFNPQPLKDNGKVVEEVFGELQDAQHVMGEMIPYSKLIRHGRPLNLKTPHPRLDEMLWSGVLLQDRALIRLTPGVGEEAFSVDLWGRSIELPLNKHARTYLLHLKGEQVHIDDVSSPDLQPGCTME